MTIKTISVAQAVAEFKTARYADGIAETTLKWYMAMLKPFASQFGQYTVDCVTVSEVCEFVIGLRKGARSTATLSDQMMGLRVFWTWCTAEYGIPNPMARIKQPPQPKPRPKAIRREDILRLYNVCSDDRFGLRERAIIKILADTGIHAAGLIGLRDEDVDLLHRRLIVREKGDKTRCLPFSNNALHDLLCWLLVRPTYSTATFCTLSTKPPSPKGEGFAEATESGGSD